MQLTQLVYVASYIDEYGIELPEFIEKSALVSGQMGVLGMTLFDNGNMIQLLEGSQSAVQLIFRKLPLETKQFHVREMIQEPLDANCLNETSIGFSLNSLRLISRSPTNIALFRLGIAAVSARVLQSNGKVMMIGFATAHG